jgi:signal transduction histidine kinase
LDWSARERKRLATELHDHLQQMLVGGDQSTIQTTSNDTAMWQHQGHDLAECEREGPVLLDNLSRPFKNQSGA